MKYLTIILIGLLSVSCMTVKRVKRNCDLFADICVTDVKTEIKIVKETQIETVYRDTIIYVKLPGKVIEKRIPVYIKEGIVESDLSVLVTPLARSTARVFNSQLEHFLEQSDSTLQIELDNANKTIRILNTEKWKTEESKTIEIIKNSKLAKVCIRAWVLVLVIGIGYFVIKYRSRILGLFK